MKKWILLFCFFSSLFLSSCGGFNPFGGKVSATSDGSYVVQTNSTDRDLLQSGYSVVYRFQSIPNLVAVKRTDLGNQNFRMTLSSDLNALLMENTRNRFPLDSINIQNTKQNYDCYHAYCEAGFDKALQTISDKKISLASIPIAIVDSGVIPSTTAISKMLFSSFNVSGNQNSSTWSHHATMIASIFSGVIKSNNDIVIPMKSFAPNAKINSIKITFVADPDQEKKNYGSMQLAVALDKAVAIGSKLVNLSLSYDDKPDDNVIMAEELVMSAAAKKGVIFVAAAGNDNVNLDSTQIYPASYGMNNLIVAGSHNNFLQKAPSSNYGSTVDISAQGAFVYVNDKNGNVVASGGTSFAVPMVISALSLYFGVNANADMNVAVQDLFSTANTYYDDSSLNAPVARYGRLDVDTLIKQSISRVYSLR